MIDTAGVEKSKSGSLQDRMYQQSQVAIETADITLMLIDARTGILSDDVYFLSIAAIIFTLFILKRIGIDRKVSILCFLIYLMYIGNLYLTNF